ncbi:MAG: hypothetical protein A2275_11490 [Bacteroidetes bacterium RIFOXYA12_FULL_35_11]|nr:MAG: hypothetical protein A2X01_18885 [Bacteroidetes bacterium GWF2_35_48]OFY72569.1 MAG: hypothetical protein A2275_11490 [Bacteroidetes bacterium RIFOXYA12_FULL_35_11]OFZ04512.1 MAG: hypothetical protein A2491_19975 [Bacteroidetes bacterium RIFOXYC12_FULL_35_7]
MNKRKIWQYPWTYKESVVIGLGFILIGFALEIFSDGKGVHPPVFPYNIILLLQLIIFIPAISFFMKKHPFIQWMTSVPAAISAILLMTIFVLLMGFIPQQAIPNSIVSRIGLTHIFESWSYLFITLYLVLILGFTLVKRLTPFSIKNTGFFLNHAGLWIIITAASLGAGDIEKRTMYCYKDNPAWLGINKSGEKKNMPFALELSKFEIQEYSPELVIIDNATGKILSDQKKLLSLKKGEKKIVSEWNVEVFEYYNYAIWFHNSFKPIKQFGAAPAAKIKAIHIETKDTISGWISIGSYKETPVLLPVNNNSSFAMTVPSPKKYHSILKLYTPDQKINKIDIEVNKPFFHKGWYLYQTGYDEKQGRWSNLSIIEAVKDPWLYVVYTGIYMLIAGSVFLFWQGKKIKK